MSTKVKQNKKKLPEWKQNLINLTKIDINAARNEYLFPAPQLLGDLLGVEERDNALWYNVFDCSVLIIINLLLLPYLMDKPWYLIGIISVIRIAALGVPKFILALHYSAHKPIIKPKWFNNLLIEFMITPFFGLPPGVYRFHHVVMHHREDNIYPYDLSSTMPYNRGNFPFCYLHYWLRFEFAIWVELPYYLYIKKYWFMFFQAIFTVSLWWGGNYYIYNYIRPAICLWLFLIPQFILSMALMWGNFSQHIFVDPDHYKDDHRLTVNLLATPYNQVTFNDGYHIIHHKYPTLHWSEMPKRFITERELNFHIDNDAVCFKDVDWFFLGAHVWFGLWERLVNKHFVPCNQKQSDMDTKERIKFLKHRLKRIEDKDNAK
mmetsp:Transcript_56836/g.51142  ORF Transcript_56836/g.51142 Transcript_56836/m.51142 type:complete len:376 (-) Transcript_56836:140-1267(-)